MSSTDESGGVFTWRRVFTTAGAVAQLGILAYLYPYWKPHTFIALICWLIIAVLCIGIVVSLGHLFLQTFSPNTLKRIRSFIRK